jgi:hypothetical protein
MLFKLSYSHTNHAVNFGIHPYKRAAISGAMDLVENLSIKADMPDFGNPAYLK